MRGKGKERLIKAQNDARNAEILKLKVRHEQINAYLKDHPEFAQLDHVKATMKVATYIGTYRYLLAMERNIEKYASYKPGDTFDVWSGRQDHSKDPAKTESYESIEYKDFKEAEVNSLLDEFIFLGTKNGQEGVDNIKTYRNDIVRLYLENEMNYDQFAVILEAFT